MLVSEIPANIRLVLALVLTTCADRLEQQVADPHHRPIAVPGFRQLYHFESIARSEEFLEQLRVVRAAILPEVREAADRLLGGALVCPRCGSELVEDNGWFCAHCGENPL